MNTQSARLHELAVEVGIATGMSFEMAVHWVDHVMTRMGLSYLDDYIASHVMGTAYAAEEALADELIQLGYDG